MKKGKKTWFRNGKKKSEYEKVLNNIEIESKRELNKINNEYKNQINSMTFQHNIQR